MFKTGLGFTKMSLALTVVAKGETEKGVKLEPGMTVDYLGHMPLAAVGIRFADGREDVAHPLCFKELR